MKITKIQMTMVLMFFFVFTYGAFASNDGIAISDKLIRLHVIANSDETYDQELKLLVRDAVIEAIEPLTKTCRDKSEVTKVLTENMPVIASVAQEEVYKNGYDYVVEAKIEREYYGTKDYGDFSLPAGVYDGLKVEIGSASGQNWWCVVFPPVCTNAATETLEGLSEEEVMLTTSEKPQYVVKFKSIEVVTGFKNLIQSVF